MKLMRNTILLQRSSNKIYHLIGVRLIGDFDFDFDLLIVLCMDFTVKLCSFLTLRVEVKFIIFNSSTLFLYALFLRMSLSISFSLLHESIVLSIFLLLF